MKRIISFIISFTLFCTSAYAGVIVSLEQTESLPFGEDEKLMRVYFFGIGACDSFLIMCGDETMLIDSGTESVSKYVITYLQDLGVTHIDYAVNTHPHDDHIDGFNKIFASIPVDKFFICFSKESTENMKRALKSAEKYNVDVISIDEQYDLSFGGNTIKLFQDVGYNINHRSLAMRLEYGDCSVFFSADMTTKACKNLSNECGDTLKSDILKLPHHGITDPTYAFMKNVDPQVCIITNGNNKQASAVVRSMKKWNYPCLFTIRNVYEFVSNGEYWTCRHVFTNPVI